MITLRIATGLLVGALAARAQGGSPSQAELDAIIAAEKAILLAQAKGAEPSKADLDALRAEKDALKEKFKADIKASVKDGLDNIISGIGNGIGSGIGRGVGNGIGNMMTWPVDTILAQVGQDISRSVQQSIESSMQFNINLDDSGDTYQSGQKSLDRKNYDQAIKRFDQVIAEKSPRADGAMYWKAYALHRSGKRDQALQTLADMEKQYPQSRWLSDARALAAEARAGAPSPESQSDEELKLLALNSLAHQEPERAIPVLEKILGDSKASPSLKRQSLFVLARSKSPKAAEILTRYAKGGANPDLQARAIEYLGTARSPENTQTLASLYATTDPATKREVIRALRRQDAAKQLVDIAKAEKDAALRKEVIRELSNMKSKEANDYLLEFLSK